MTFPISKAVSFHYIHSRFLFKCMYAIPVLISRWWCCAIKNTFTKNIRSLILPFW